MSISDRSLAVLVGFDRQTGANFVHWWEPCKLFAKLGLNPDVHRYYVTEKVTSLDIFLGSHGFLGATPDFQWFKLNSLKGVRQPAKVSAIS